MADKSVEESTSSTSVDEATRIQAEQEAAKTSKCLAEFQEFLSTFFVKDSMDKDEWCQSKMGENYGIAVDLLFEHVTIKSISEKHDQQSGLLKKAVLEAKNCYLDKDGIVRPWSRPEQNILILRDLPAEMSESEILEIFKSADSALNMPFPTTVKLDLDQWFVSFDSEKSCKSALMLLRSIKFQEKRISARLKTAAAKPIYTQPLHNYGATSAESPYGTMSNASFDGMSPRIDDDGSVGSDGPNSKGQLQGKMFDPASMSQGNGNMYQGYPSYGAPMMSYGKYPFPNQPVPGMPPQGPGGKKGQGAGGPGTPGTPPNAQYGYAPMPPQAAQQQMMMAMAAANGQYPVMMAPNNGMMFNQGAGPGPNMGGKMMRDNYNNGNRSNGGRGRGGYSKGRNQDDSHYMGKKKNRNDSHGDSDNNYNTNTNSTASSVVSASEIEESDGGTSQSDRGEHPHRNQDRRKHKGGGNGDNNSNNSTDGMPMQQQQHPAYDPIAAMYMQGVPYMNPAMMGNMYPHNMNMGGMDRRGGKDGRGRGGYRGRGGRGDNISPSNLHRNNQQQAYFPMMPGMVLDMMNGGSPMAMDPSQYLNMQNQNMMQGMYPPMNQGQGGPRGGMSGRSRGGRGGRGMDHAMHAMNGDMMNGQMSADGMMSDISLGGNRDNGEEYKDSGHYNNNHNNHNHHNHHNSNHNNDNNDNNDNNASSGNHNNNNNNNKTTQKKKKGQDNHDEGGGEAGDGSQAKKKTNPKKKKTKTPEFAPSEQEMASSFPSLGGATESTTVKDKDTQAGSGVVATGGWAAMVSKTPTPALPEDPQSGGKEGKSNTKKEGENTGDEAKGKKKKKADGSTTSDASLQTDASTAPVSTAKTTTSTSTSTGSDPAGEGGKEMTATASTSTTNSVGVGSSSGDIVSETRAASQGGSASGQAKGDKTESSGGNNRGKGDGEGAEEESPGSVWGSKKSFVDVVRTNGGK